MKLNILDNKGKILEEITLSKELFGQDANDNLLAQYIKVYTANQRQGTSSTKTRGEVSGGGKKPFKQKHTGRARAGSTRGPIWRHGGISHGPKPKDWSLDLPKKMRKLALAVALSSKFSNKNITIINDLAIKESKTKLVAELLSTLKLPNKTLIVSNTKDNNLVLASNNIPGLETAIVSNVNAYQVLKARNVLFVKDAVETLESRYAEVKEEK